MQNKKPPHCIIGGAPKCGTTSLAATLAKHPEIYVVPDEPHFFGSDVTYHEKNISERDYLELFKQAPTGNLCIEKSTWYLFSENAASEIYRWNPETKIIFILREPLSMLRSLHWHLFTRFAREPEKEFEVAYRLQNERAKGRQVPRNLRFQEQVQYYSVGCYATQILRFLEFFQPEQVKIFLFEDLIYDWPRVWRECIEFLQVTDVEGVVFEHQNEAYPGLRFPGFERFGAGDAARNVGQVLKSLRLRTPAIFLFHQLKKLNRTNPNKPHVGEAFAAEVRDDFKDEVLRLEEILGRNLAHWRQGPS